MGTRDRRRTASEQAEMVVIRIPEEGLVVYGQMRSTDCEVIIDGIVEGMTHFDHRPLKLTALTGFSNQRGQIWLERVLVPRTTVNGDERRPSTITFKAYVLFSGDFDPRTTLISTAEMTLSGLPPLVFDEPKTRRAGVRESDGKILYESEHVELSLTGSLQRDLTPVEHRVIARFREPQPHTAALGLLEQTICLIELLTASTVRTNDVLYTVDGKHANHWRSGGQEERIGSISDWLDRPGNMLELLRSLLPEWIPSTSGPYGLHRVHALLGAPAREAMEGLFLTYCQSFEDLNGIRVPLKRLMPDDDYKADVLDVLNPVIESLSGSDLRRRIRRSLVDANRVGLEDRLRAVFVQQPFWLTIVQECFPDVLAAIAKRRNDLAHGDPRGAVHSDADANNIHLQSSVMFLFCLTELLYLTTGDETRVEKMVGMSGEATHIVWLARQMNSGKFDA